MEIRERVNSLYEKDTREAYGNLKELEALSDREDTLYPYLEEFLGMLKSETYVIRVRGFRLLCKQAQWDRENIIDDAIDDVLAALHDKKPTAVRQALQYLEFLAPHKRELVGRIREAALAVDCGRFKDTMAPLIAKDIRHLLQCLDAHT